MNQPNLLSLETYDYALPENRIAKFPVTPRDASKLLLVSNGKFVDAFFRDLPDFLQAGDVLVLNDTKVIPARILCERGEILLVREVESNCWDTLIHPGRHFKPGAKFSISGIDVEVLSQSKIGRLIRFSGNTQELLKLGSVPLPPYIDREPVEADQNTYQTIYATHPGSVAAPTAGMHFTETGFDRLKSQGVQICKITLHVGPGTFRPVKNPDVSKHSLEAESYSCSAETWETIRNASRVIAVGTTTTRTLESIARTQELTGFTDLFIYPGFQFQVVKALVTNFHLPKSSLLMLVAAFAGYQRTMDAYQHAIRSGYRFYSYGDAMCIL